VAVAAAAASRLHDIEAPRALRRYDLLLLHGTPVEMSETLPEGIDEGEPVEVRGEEWTVAAVRERPQGPQLVCVRGL